MKISHLSKPWLPVPSLSYGAIEKMIAELIEVQVASGDTIHLYAPGNSVNKAKIDLISLYKQSQGDRGLDRNTELAQAMHCLLKSRDLNTDIIHAHSVDPFLALAPFTNIPSIFTFYSNPTPAGEVLSRLASDHTNYTFLSESHRKSFPWIKKGDVIYFGINANNFPFSSKKQDYLAFVGSISDKKGIREAIEISRLSNMKLKIAAKVRSEDTNFYENTIRDLIKSSVGVEYLGEVDNQTRNELLKNATAMLFPIKWEEPFGMVMIESLVVGTPVIAFNRGSVPEVVENNKTGFIVDNVSQAVKSVKCVKEINPVDCRESVENKFNIKSTESNFKKLYERILSK